MPLLEFICNKCGNKAEVIVKTVDSTSIESVDKDCEVCEAEDSLEYNSLPSTSFVLKGVGWFNSGGY